MGNELQQVANRIRELREILEIEPNQVAAQVNLPLQTYLDYENASEDIPIGVLYAVAGVLQVDPTVLLTGAEPRMNDYTIVRGGKGIAVERYPGYSFISLAYNYRGRDMEPMLVTLGANDTPAELVTHGGQEFNYVLEGTVAVTINQHEFLLHAGDCIYFNPRNPHGQKAVGGDARFITIINE
ncbi:MAG: helix-turn-helix transcriptional regulator [Provencibacterium sp.]|nr:helix-turn-helix transcriptional regulator [Provencibacterium sp.]